MWETTKQLSRVKSVVPHCAPPPPHLQLKTLWRSHLSDIYQQEGNLNLDCVPHIADIPMTEGMGRRYPSACLTPGVGGY